MRRVIRIIRNILLALIAAIVAIAAILTFNVITHGSRQLQVAAIPKAPVDTQRAAARLAEAIRFRTISSYAKLDQHADALRGMQAHIERSFPAFHAAANARSSPTTACSTPGEVRTLGRSRSRCSRTRTSCRWLPAPTRTGNTRPMMA